MRPPQGSAAAAVVAAVAVAAAAWLPCARASDDGKADDDSTSLQQEIIFVVVIAMILCCGCTCLSTKTCSSDPQRRQHDALNDPLLARENMRHDVFANSLVAEENEWICPVCAFENRPRAACCLMCGTTCETADQYYEALRERRDLADLQGEDEYAFRVTAVAPSKRNNLGAADLAGSDGHRHSTPWRPRPSSYRQSQTLNRSTCGTSRGSSAAADAAAAVKASRLAPSADPTDRLSGLGLDAGSRQQALLIRRFNKLNLRQRAAHRRRLWQRRLNPDTQELEWVRVTAPVKLVDQPTSSIDKTGSQATLGIDLSRSKVEMNEDVEQGGGGGGGGGTQMTTEAVRIGGDSFNDPPTMSYSPGFTSVLDTTSPGALVWQEVSGVQEQHTTATKQRILSHTSDGEASMPPLLRMGGPGVLPDLEAVAAMHFRRKQQWFQSSMDVCRHALNPPGTPAAVTMTVRRDNMLPDSFTQLMSLDPVQLSKRLRIRFKDEPGIDAGGLLREWFMLTAQQLFDPQIGLFVAHGEESAYGINPMSGVCNEMHLEYFRFAGRFVGKALLEHQTLPAYFSLPVLKHLLSVPITFSDLEFVDGELYHNLMYLRNNEGAGALCLDFTVTSEHMGMRSVHELKPGGADIDVTDDNKQEYLTAVFKYRLLDSVADQLWHLLCGLYEVVPKEALSVFDYQELELLISGVPDIDVEDWKRHARYVGVYKALGSAHPVVKWFWDVVESFTHEERARLLQFTTGSTRLPAQGFKALEANDGNFRLFTVAGISKQECLYPRSHTCFNRIDLPTYDSKEELEGYLTLVINMEITGFQMD